MSVEIRNMIIFNIDTYELLRCFAAFAILKRKAASRFHDAAHHSPLNMISFL